MAGKRPRTRKAHDRIINPLAGRVEIETDMALAPFDRLARDMETKWGIDRLQGLVSPAMAKRYGEVIAQLNAAVEAADPAAVVTASEAAIKGLHVMDAVATGAGHQQAAGLFIEHEIEAGDGEPAFRFGVLIDGQQWQAAKAARPDLQFFTMREIGIAMRNLQSAFPIAQIKAKFPAATISGIRKPPVDWKNGGDKINLVGDDDEF